MPEQDIAVMSAETHRRWQSENNTIPGSPPASPPGGWKHEAAAESVGAHPMYGPCAGPKYAQAGASGS